MVMEDYQWNINESRGLNDLAIQHDSRSFSRDLQVSGYPHHVAVKHPDIENSPHGSLRFVSEKDLHISYIYIYHIIYIYIYHLT